MGSNKAKKTQSNKVDKASALRQEESDHSELEEDDSMQTELPEVEEDDDIHNIEQPEVEEENKKKKRKPGIIYLPIIPPYMTVLTMREILQEFGDVGRIFLQPDEKHGKGKKRPGMNFTEGWIEFKSKRAAKYVAQMLNNNKIHTRKKSKYYDFVWNIKYLPNFKWVHLSERLAYERAVHRQRMRTEIAQAKREAHHFQASVERSDKIRRFKRKQKLDEVLAEEGFEVPQRMLTSEHEAKKLNIEDREKERANLLQDFFGSKS